MQTLSTYVSALSVAVADVQRVFDAAAEQNTLSDRLSVRSFSVRFGFLIDTTWQTGFEIGVWPLNASYTTTHAIRQTEANWISLEFVRVPVIAER